MLLTLLALATDVQRVRLGGCYKDETELVVDKNLETLTLRLVRSGFEECNRLERGVLVNLTLHADGVLCDNITLLLSNFSYENTTEIVFRLGGGDRNLYQGNDPFCNNSG